MNTFNVLRLAIVAVIGLAGTSTLKADLLITCAGCSPSTVGGTGIVASSSLAPPDLTIVRSPNDNSGLPQGPFITPVVLIPNNVVGGAALSFTTNVITGGNLVGTATNPCDLPCEFPSFGFAAQWSTAGSNLLTNYLGDTQPSGPPVLFDDLLAATQALEPSATGYFVYTGPIAAIAQFSPGNDSQVTYGGIANFPAGTIFTMLLSDPLVDNNLEFFGVPSRDATGVAGSLIVGAPAAAPEPSSWVLVGAAVLGCIGRARASKSVSRSYPRGR